MRQEVEAVMRTGRRPTASAAPWTRWWGSSENKALGEEEETRRLLQHSVIQQVKGGGMQMEPCKENGVNGDREKEESRRLDLAAYNQHCSTSKYFN